MQSSRRAARPAQQCKHARLLTWRESCWWNRAPALSLVTGEEMPTDRSQSCISSALLNPAAVAAAEAAEMLPPPVWPSGEGADAEGLSSAGVESDKEGTACVASLLCLAACVRATNVRILSASCTISEALACPKGRNTVAMLGRVSQAARACCLPSEL